MQVGEMEYPDFKVGQRLELKHSNYIMIGQFVEWRHKTDRPFGYWICIEQTYPQYVFYLAQLFKNEAITEEKFFKYLDKECFEKAKKHCLNDMYLYTINRQKFTPHPQ